MKKNVLFVGMVGLLTMVILLTGCLKSASPDVTPIPAGGALAATPVEIVLSDATAMAGTAIANATLAAQPAEGTSPTATPTMPPSPIPTATFVPPTAVPPTAVLPTSAPAATTAPGQVTHVVQPGDNLFRIALRYGTTVEAIASANGIANPALIKVGQVLRIPTSGVQPNPQPGGETTYTVQPGDNLFRIALRYGLSYTTLAQYNGIANPAFIRVGQVLRIPSR
jgi:LysM repeat protein